MSAEEGETGGGVALLAGPFALGGGALARAGLAPGGVVGTAHGEGGIVEHDPCRAECVGQRREARGEVAESLGPGVEFTSPTKFRIRATIVPRS